MKYKKDFLLFFSHREKIDDIKKIKNTYVSMKPTRLTEIDSPGKSLKR